MRDSHKFKDSRSDLRNKCLDHQFSIVFTKNLIKSHESLNNKQKAKISSNFSSEDQILEKVS